MKKRQTQEPQQAKAQAFVTHVALSQRAAAAVLAVVATGRSLSEVVSSAVEEWSRAIIPVTLAASAVLANDDLIRHILSFPMR